VRGENTLATHGSLHFYRSLWMAYFTVTLFARLRGLSGS
jgi:hypothetical protein